VANRPNVGGGNGPTTLPAGVNRPNIGSGNRPNIGGGATTLPAIANRPNIGNGNRTNIGSGNNFNNSHNNINIASNRQYYNNWQHGNWNGNWNRPGGGGYWNGWAHGYAHGYWHGGWGGYWHGGWGGYWGRPWYAAPIAWGLGAWAVGSIMYNSGYAAYSNPYYVTGGSTAAYYDYSQPITVINQQPDANVMSTLDPANATTAESAPPPEVQDGTSHMELARNAFKRGDYVAALSENDLAIKSLPNDAALHEFRALILFATRDYKQAAATLYAVLSAGPGWDWTTLSGMYASVTTYTEQLRQLEAYVKQNQSAADARFVLAYQYLTCGYPESARKQFEDIVKLQPENQLAAQLLTLVGGGPAEGTTAQPIPQPPDAESTAGENATPPADIDANRIVGKWTAKRKDGSKFSLDLTSDAKFTWGFEQGGRKQEFGGKYFVDGAVLVLERTDGAQMPGIVTLADTGFNFKLYGGPPDDSGLDFSK
jgi:tetratricopeptide (TPR) repeat protein